MPTAPFAKFDPEILEIVRSFRLLDDTFMMKVFEDKDCLELALRIIMNIPTLEVKEHHSDSPLKNLQGRSVRFDVWAVDAAGTQYNIEVQRSDKGAGSRRARYNSAMLDANVTNPGDDLQNLPETYVIFITENDVLKKGNLSYNIDRMYQVDETGNYEIFNDGAHIIYVNGAYGDASSELGKLMADFREQDPEKMHYETLKKRANYFKQEPKGVGTMCRAEEEYVRVREARGEARGRLKTICDLIRAGVLSVEVASAKLEIPVETIRAHLDDFTQ